MQPTLPRSLAFALLVAGCNAGGGRPIVDAAGPARTPADLVFIFNGSDGSSSQDASMEGSDGALAEDLSTDRDMTRVCDPMAPASCDQVNNIQTCRPDGSGFDLTACPVNTICQAGVCTCVSGATICQNAQQILLCGMDKAFHPGAVCPMGTTCLNGLCDDLRCNDELSSQNPYALPTDAWPRFRHDNRNTGWTPAVVADQPKLKWKVFVGGTNLNNQKGLASGPVVNQNNVIFIGAGDLDGRMGAFYSFNDQGKMLFSFPANRGYGISTPAVRLDGTSYFSTTNRTLNAVDPMGMKAWSYPVGSQADSDPLVTKDGILIYGCDDGVLYAINNMGMLAWKSDMNSGPGEVDSGLAESCDGRIYAGGKNGWFQIDAQTGKTNWKATALGTYSALLSSPLVDATGTMYGFDSAGNGTAIDSNGKVLWNKTLGPAGAGSSPARIAGTLFVVLNDGALHAVDATTGLQKWTKTVNNSAAVYLNAGPIIDGKQHIYFNSSDGFIYAFDTAGNSLWKIAASGVASNMAWSGTMAIGHDGTLYVPGNDGNLYAFQ